MTVYFAYSHRGNLMKIGYSENPPTRIAALRSWTGLPFKSVLELPGNELMEHRLQARFSEHREADEYFDFRGSLVEFVLRFPEAVDKIRSVMDGRTVFHGDDVTPIIRGGFREKLAAASPLPEEVDAIPGDTLRVSLEMDDELGITAK